MTKGSTKRERLEGKMIEYIDLTKKTEVNLRKDDFISLQVEAMAESIRESLPKRQAYACLHEMQGVVFRYVSNQLGQQMGQPMVQQMTPQMGQQMGQNMRHQMAVSPLTATAGQSAGGRVQESAVSRPLGTFSSSL